MLITVSSFFFFFFCKPGRGEKLTGSKVEECHAKDGGEICSGEEEGTHEGEGFHRGAVPFARVGNPPLLTRNLQVQPRFALRHDVVQLLASQNHQAKTVRGGVRDEETTYRFSLNL